MKTKLYTFIFLVSATIFISCKTATKLYNKGNYDEAVVLAAKKLQKNPNDAELQNLISAAYQNAVSIHESDIRAHSNSGNEMRWEWMYNEYAALQNLYNLTKANISIAQIVRPVDYSSYLETYRYKAAATRIERGDRFFTEGSRQGYKNAYREYQVANGLKQGDFFISNKMKEAYGLAVINVEVLPADNYGYQYSSYNNNYNITNINETVLNSLKYHSGNEFVHFYSEWDARNQQVNIDHLIDMRFSHFNIGRTRDDRSSRDVTKRIVVKETVYRPDSIVYEYANVTAKITTTRRWMQSEGALQVNIRDNDGRWLWSDNFRGDHNWSTEFSTYTGDARALSESDKQLVNRSAANAPYEDEIIRHIVNEIDNNIADRIRDFYRRF
jgi:hypothetical protein